MNLSKLRVILKTSISTVALGGIVLFGSLLPDQAKAITYSPAYTTTNTLGASTATNVQSSFGFYFDVEGNATINGLGFAAQDNWTTGNYIVKLWSYVNGGAVLSDYTKIAEATFMPGGPYTLQNNYLWQALAGNALINLPDTYTTDFTDQLGYAISAIGDFSATDANPLLNTRVEFETGTASFDSKILMAGNGFNESGFPLFDVPFFPNNSVGTNGYFNANMSFVTVPGPLPLLGAAAGFAWTRRLRTRISASK